jgi:hypothetical protein
LTAFYEVRDPQVTLSNSDSGKNTAFELCTGAPDRCMLSPGSEN